MALAPSSRFLCAEMAADIDPEAGPVIELGAGTGNITQAISRPRRGAPEPPFHRDEPRVLPTACARRFPGLNVYNISAGDCGGLPVEGAQAVVSGLPLLSMPIALQRDILTGFAARVRPGGS